MNEKSSSFSQLNIQLAVKKPYLQPQLQEYGSVSALTLNGTGTGIDGGATAGMTKQSDRAMKCNIRQVGIHPLGFGLYLFDFKPEFQHSDRTCRQFGVMADEVERVLPSAVVVGDDGYRKVNYTMLGIDFSGQRRH